MSEFEIDHPDNGMILQQITAVGGGAMHTRRFLISLFLMTSLVIHGTHHHMHLLLQTMIMVGKAHMVRLGTHASQPLALWMSVVTEQRVT